MTIERIDLDEHAQRRERVLERLDGAVGVVFAGASRDPLRDEFRPHSHFTWLTGLVDEPDAVLVLDPQARVESRRSLLFLKPLDPEIERWDGLRLGIGAALRERVGIKGVFRLPGLPRFLFEAVRRTKRVACLHPLAHHTQSVSPDLELFQLLAQRMPGLAIEDRSTLLDVLRSTKSDAEHGLVARAAEITEAGFRAGAAVLRPGANEFEVQEAIEHTYRTLGSRGPAYGTIVGAGINSTVLHYQANDRTIEDGDLVCIDSGASFAHYGADVTRTFPASGCFTKRQREVYAVVLEALEAALAAVKAGVWLSDLDDAAREVIRAAGHADAFVHGIGHHLGLETHDASPDAPLEAGAVITIEPGIYLPAERIGIRIEDDVIVTEDGHRNLTASLPKAIDEVEALVGG